MTPLDVSERYFEPRRGLFDSAVSETAAVKAAKGTRHPTESELAALKAAEEVRVVSVAARAANYAPSDVHTAAAALLNDAGAFLRRFVVMDDRQAAAAVLWIAHTYAIDAAESTPYLCVTSAEKRSGKSRLREVLELLVREPLPAANISDAALFRAIAATTPTVLLDEADAIFKARDREDLRGLLNAGVRRGAVAYRMGGNGKTTLEKFPVFCPKAFFGIGEFLPDTLADRSIPIRLQRRTRDEHAERFRFRDAEADGHLLRDRLDEWLVPQVDHLSRARPVLPDELDDRAQDAWEPLLAIADLAGGDWPARARDAAVALSSGEERDDESLTVRLLTDIREAFEGTDGRLRTADLLDRLYRLEESPWADRALTAYGLSQLLKPYRIKTMSVRHDGKVVRGYRVEQFADAFARVLTVTTVTPVTTEAASQARCNGDNACNANHAAAAPIIVVGDDGYLDLLDRAHRNGHITDRERRDRRRLHFTIRGVLGDGVRAVA
jgi:hypothetical protein